MEFPVGYKFEPTNYEIVTQILLPKLQGLLIESYGIVEENIYALHPQALNWNHVPYLHDYERYYFVKRTPIACDEKGDRKYAKRTLDSGEGFWRKSREDHIFDSHKRVVGNVALLNFSLFKNGKNRSNAIKTKFIMYEYTLPETKNDFQEWTVCRIKDKARENMKSSHRVNNDLYYDYTPQPQPPIQYEPHENTQSDSLGYYDPYFGVALEPPLHVEALPSIIQESELYDERFMLEVVDLIVPYPDQHDPKPNQLMNDSEASTSGGGNWLGNE